MRGARGGWQSEPTAVKEEGWATESYLVLVAEVLEGNEIELLAIGRVWSNFFARSAEMQRMEGADPDPHGAAFAC